MSNRVLASLMLATVVVVSAAANHASAFCRMTTQGGAQIGSAPCSEDGEPLEWTNTCLSYAIDNRGSQWMTNTEIEEAVDLAFKEWENADCGGAPPNVIFKPLLPSNCQRTEYNCSGNVNTIAFLDPWRDPCVDEGGFDPNAFAVTTVWHNTSTGEILDVDMMINDEPASRFNAGGPYANCPLTGCPRGSGTSPGPADLRSIVTHEIGHFLGIGHSNDEDATMFPSTDRESVDKRSLAPDDIEAICTIYPPGNLDPSCNATPMGGLELDCEQKACTTSSCRTSGSTSGCSAGGHPQHGPWSGIVAALLGLTALRRRSRLHAVRS
jgi:hypothetical protein